jgi:hypothetical protein
MNPNRKFPLPLAFVLGAVGLIVVVQVANAIHPRPKGASPIRVSLVPAYERCTAPNTSHGPPLGFPSCSPPVQTSDYLTVGTPDANGAAANSVGFVRISVKVGNPGPPEDSAVEFVGSISDVRCKTGAGTTCGSPNDAGGPDYTGELEGTMTLRVTDHYNGPNRDQAATVQDLPQPINLNCVGTPDPTIGSTCVFPVVSCSSCPPPKEGVRTVIEVSQVQIKDGGADGSAVSRQDNTLFMVQGVFLP